jgi:Ca2+-binding RTX toxin-like protein
MAAAQTLAEIFDQLMFIATGSTPSPDGVGYSDSRFDYGGNGTGSSGTGGSGIVGEDSQNEDDEGTEEEDELRAENIAMLTEFFGSILASATTIASQDDGDTTEIIKAVCESLFGGIFGNVSNRASEEEANNLGVPRQIQIRGVTYDLVLKHGRIFYVNEHSFPEKKVYLMTPRPGGGPNSYRAEEIPASMLDEPWEPVEGQPKCDEGCLNDNPSGGSDPDGGASGGGTSGGGSSNGGTSTNQVQYSYMIAKGSDGAANMVRTAFGTGASEHIVGGGLMLGGAGNDTLTGATENDLIYGDEGNDTLTGEDGGDVLDGGTGDDTLDGGSGNDLLIGGLGDDSLVGGFGNDVLKGEEGNNILEGGAGADTLDGSGGFAVASYRTAWFGVTVDLSDTSRNTGEAAGDTFIDVNGLWGSGHHDTLVGNQHANWIIADGGNDLVQGLAGADTLYGSTGDDTLEGGQGNDTLHGESGNNILEGGQGADAHFGAGGFAVASYRQATGAVQVYLDGSGTNTGEAQGDTYDSVNGLWGSGHADVLVGNHYGNWIIADAGHDLVSGGLGSDTLYGSTGHDTLNGGGDHDVLYGEGGDDALWGSAGADRLLGGDGHDTLRGEDGADTLDGGAGTDQLVGGAGRDVFVAEAGSVDGFIDFTAGEDKIQLSGSGFGLGAGALSTAAFRQAGVALTGAQKVLYDRGTGDVWYDADGVGAGAAIKLAMIGAGKAVTASDFLIV